MSSYIECEKCGECAVELLGDKELACENCAEGNLNKGKCDDCLEEHELNENGY